jgi:hypothetical protein
MVYEFDDFVEDDRFNMYWSWSFSFPSLHWLH